MLAKHCVDICEKYNREIAGSEFSSMATRTKMYFEAVCSRKGEQSLPRISNPCRDFERIIKNYLDNEIRNKTG